MIRAVKLLPLFLQEVEEEVLRPVVVPLPFLWITSLGKRRSQLSILLLLLYAIHRSIEGRDG